MISNTTTVLIDARKSTMDREKKLMSVDSARTTFKYRMVLSKKVKGRQREEADFGCLFKTHLQVYNDVGHVGKYAQKSKEGA